MARSKRKYDVFISYSRRDAHLVQPLLEFLRISGKRVFRDVDSIAKGDQWERAISDALSQCKVFLLFWCCHSAQSSDVAAEIDQVRKRKDVTFIPGILCDTPMPKHVAAYQGIDFRKSLVHSCNGKHELTPPSPLLIPEKSQSEPPKVFPEIDFWSVDDFPRAKLAVPTTSSQKQLFDHVDVPERESRFREIALLICSTIGLLSLFFLFFFVPPLSEHAFMILTFSAFITLCLYLDLGFLYWRRWRNAQIQLALTKLKGDVIVANVFERIQQALNDD